MLFLQPAIQLENVTRLPNRVAVLVDASESMAPAGAARQPTRAERAAAAHRQGQARLRRLAHAHLSTSTPSAAAVATVYSRSDVATPGEGGADLTSSSEEQLARAAPGARRRPPAARGAGRAARPLRGRDLGGVVVLSDGIDNGRFGSARAAGCEERGGGVRRGARPESRDFLRSLDAPVHTAVDRRAPA